MLRRPLRSTSFPYTTLFRSVKQRLSRGRDLLRVQMAALVEGALTRSRPGKAFTLAVLAALPGVVASSTTAATLGAAGKVADRKSTRLNSSHTVISYAVFCLK